MSTIYITEIGSIVHISSRHIVVTKGKNKLLQLPLIKVDRLLLFGNIQITSQAAGVLLDEGIEVCYLSTNGRFRGKLQPAESKNVLLRVAQYERFLDDVFQVELARTIVTGKINNGIALIKRYQDNYPNVDFSQEIELIEKTLSKIPSQKTVESIMGSEGLATAVYFKAFGKMFRKELKFDKRTRRPPKDPVNAILSFGYTLITNEIFSMITAHGLDPYIGFLHGLSYGRPSLALDLVEEFRHPFIDRFTLSLFNNDILSVNDFEPVENQGVYLTGDARKLFFEHYDRRINEKFKLPNTETETSFRQLFKSQTLNLSKAILSKGEYVPFRIYK